VRAQYAQDSNVLSLCLDGRMLDTKVFAQCPEISSPTLSGENILPSSAKGDSRSTSCCKCGTQIH